MCGAGHSFMRGIDHRVERASGTDDERACRALGRPLAACRRGRDLRRCRARQARAAARAIRCRASRRPNSRSSGSASTTSSRSRPPKKGSGPAFNGTSCAVCHNVPAIGGGGVIAEVRAARPRRAGEFAGARTPPVDTLFHLFSIPTHGCQPVHARRSERHRAPRADSAVRRRAGRGDPRRDAAGARGSATIATATASAAGRRSSSTSPPGERRVGRFGWKAQHATLLAFGADAYRNEMGITNDLFPQELGVRRSRRADAAVRSDPGSRGSAAIRGRAGAASTTSRRS